MRIRIVLSGIAAGIISLVALWFPFYAVEPAKFISDWTYAKFAATLPDWFTLAVVAFCGLVIFVFGWIAARWNWSENWRASLISGGGAGLLAGCLIYDFIGTICKFKRTFF